MSPLPAMQSVAADLYDRLAPLASLDEANGYAFAVLCGAIGAMWQTVADLSEDRDGRPGWAVMVDVETAPAIALPWNAAQAGVRLTRGATEDAQRDEVRRRSGVARGRPASMIAKTKTTLTGTQSVRLIERASGSAWQIIVITRTAETPDPAATYAAALTEKPGGDILTHVVSDEVLWAEPTVTWDDVDPGVTWADVVLADVT